jgi:hypothetical protein
MLIEKKKKEGEKKRGEFEEIRTRFDMGKQGPYNERH